MTIEQLKKSIAELDENIAQGREFEKRGYDCGMMMAITYSIRNRLENELLAEVSHEKSI